MFPTFRVSFIGGEWLEELASQIKFTLFVFYLQSKW